MIVRLVMDDALFTVFERRAAQLAASGRNKSATAEELMTSLLDRCKNLNPVDRPCVVNAETRAELEQVLDIPQIRDEKDILAGAKKLAELEIGTIRIDFTPAQWSHLKNFAARNELTLEPMLKDVCYKISAAIFNGGLGFAGHGKIA